MKPALILLPGLMCDAAVWAPQVRALADIATALIPAYGMRNHLEDMAHQVLQTAPPGPFALAGHSMGGRIALEVMRLAPQRVSHLALLDTGTHPLAGDEAGEREKAGRMALLALAQSQGMRAMARQWASGMVHPQVVGSPLFEAVLDMLERSNPQQFAAQIEALLNRPDAAPVLPKITCPTLVLTGREDVWSPPEQHAAIAAAIPGATLCVLERCGHMSSMEQPEAVSQALRNWLSA